MALSTKMNHAETFRVYANVVFREKVGDEFEKRKMEY